MQAWQRKYVCELRNEFQRNCLKGIVETDQERQTLSKKTQKKQQQKKAKPET